MSGEGVEEQGRKKLKWKSEEDKWGRVEERRIKVLKVQRRKHTRVKRKH